VTREERAQQLWSILVFAARWRQILTYELVGKACGLPPPSLGDFLRPIQQLCTERAIPPLTSIVVNKSDGLPGDGFIAAKDIPRAQLSVFEHDWFGEDAPSGPDLADAYTRAPGKR